MPICAHGVVGCTCIISIQLVYHCPPYSTATATDDNDAGLLLTTPYNNQETEAEAEG